MAKIMYVGDEVTAAGYRLAGLETRVPGPAETQETVRQILSSDADLVLLSAELTASLSRVELRQLLSSAKPLVSVVADVYDRHAPPAMGPEVRAALGIEQ